MKTYYIHNMVTGKTWLAGAHEARLYSAFAFRHEMRYMVTAGISDSPLAPHEIP